MEIFVRNNNTLDILKESAQARGDVLLWSRQARGQCLECDLGGGVKINL